MRKAKPVNPMQYAGPNAKVPFLAPDVLTKVIPAPVEGWDAISPLAEMDPKRAPILQNWVPRPGYVELRGGYAPFAGAGVVPIETLMVWRPDHGPQKMFAAGDSSIYDASQGGLAPLAFGGFTSARWQYTNFMSGAGVNVLQAANGVDPVIQYDGTTWTKPAITGLPGAAASVFAVKQRLWYVINNSSQVYFLPTGNITGAIDSFLDFGTIWAKGGYLVTMGEWTIDGGSGPQSYVAFISNQGQIALYQGTDPTNINAWQLAGTFDVALPIGRRCFLRTGSDLAMITQQGVLPISQSLP